VTNDLADRLLARIRQLREAKGLTQETFAEKAGLAYKYYQHVESGRRRDIRLSTIEKLAKALDLEPFQLLNFDFTPSALAEDRAEGDSPTTPGKGGRKAARRG
jgi:transcriptional regulator with XRE-family HTH domain